MQRFETRLGLCEFRLQSEQIPNLKRHHRYALANQTRTPTRHPIRDLHAITRAALLRKIKQMRDEQPKTSNLGEEVQQGREDRVAVILKVRFRNLRVLHRAKTLGNFTLKLHS